MVSEPAATPAPKPPLALACTGGCGGGLPVPFDVLGDPDLLAPHLARAGWLLTVITVRDRPPMLTPVCDGCARRLRPVEPGLVKGPLS